jgi:hypothetical protein
MSPFDVFDGSLDDRGRTGMRGRPGAPCPARPFPTLGLRILPVPCGASFFGRSARGRPGPGRSARSARGGRPVRSGLLPGFESRRAADDECAYFSLKKFQRRPFVKRAQTGCRVFQDPVSKTHVLHTFTLKVSTLHQSFIDCKERVFFRVFFGKRKEI